MNKIEIIYEDKDILVINKPATILSIPDRWDADKISVYHALAETRPDLKVVHRLDKDTSGVMVFAQHADAHKSLNDQFSANENYKSYLAVVNGQVLESGSIDSPIAADPYKAGKMTIHRKGKESLTDYEPLEIFKDYTLLKVIIHTGRTHQIRVHLSSISHPLAVDPLYGSELPITIENIKKRNLRYGDEEPTPLMARVPLHAQYLRLKHPGTNKEMEFEAALPKDFKALVSQLRKWGR